MRTPRPQDTVHRRRALVRRAAAGSVVLALLAAPGLLDHTPPGGAEPVSRAETAPTPDGDPVTALLELDTATSWQAWRSAQESARRARRSPEATRRAAASAGGQQRRMIATAADRIAQELRTAVPDAQVLYRTLAVVSGLAVRVPAGELGALRSLPGVRAVHPIAHKHRANAYSVPLTGSPTVWAGTDAVPGNTGQGVTIGIVDSGIDYTHADFGGPGTAAAFKAVDGSRPAPPGLFPNAKVVGGWDFVGDDYNTDPAEPSYDPKPHPDANPLDCTANGHGTHVAGTAAGFGVTRDGATYTGPYRPGLDPDSFLVGPGAAPGARLYALRVFGCNGASDEIAHALDRAADPNQDGDFSDRLDVVNLSLGGSFGDPGDGDAVAAERLAATGTVVVASAGNDGDVYGVGSSPAIAPRVISVAASVDGHTDADGIRILPPPGASPGAAAAAPGGPASGGGGAGTVGSGPGGPVQGSAGRPGLGDAASASGGTGGGDVASSVRAIGPGLGGVASAGGGAGPGGPVGRPGPGGGGGATAAVRAGRPVPGGPAVDPGVPVEPGPEAGAVVPAHWSSKYTGWDTQDVTGELVLPGPGNADGCTPFGPADAARLRGRVAVVAWTTRDSDRACGSGARADRAADAGAVGVIFAADGDEIGEIAGNARIPAVIVAREDGERLRAAAASATPVRVQLAAPGNTLRGSVAQDQPERTDMLAEFSSRGNGLPGLVKPDITAPGETILSAAVGTGSRGVRKDGTSMSAPHLAGVAALVRAAHPEWTAEQVKAALMNTANADLTTGPRGTGEVYGPERVGAGRVRADLAVRTPAIAYAVGEGVPTGAVGVSFGEVPVTGPLSLTREVEVRNLGDRPLTYRTGYRAATEVRGAGYTVSPAEVAVPVGGTARVRVTLAVPVPAALDRHPDPTLELRQAGHARVYRPEASGRLLLTPVGDAPEAPQLRVPVFAAPRPASELAGELSARLPIDLAGRPGLLLRIGGEAAPAGPRAEPSSLVSAFVLGGQGTRWPDCGPRHSPGRDCASSPRDRIADLRLAGAASDAPAVAARGGDPLEDGILYLVATTWAAAATPVGKAAVRASLDTDGDGRTDVVVEADRLTGSDVLVARTLDATTGKELDVQPLNGRWGDTDTGLLDSDTVVLPVRLSALPGLRQSTARIRYALWTGLPQSSGVPDAGRALDAIGLVDGHPSLPLNVLHPALDIRVGAGGRAAVAVPEEPGTLLAVRRDLWAYALQGPGALLLVHHGNAAGRRTQVVPLPIW
ncbi:S8 family serine peptidase [Peterkaempfera bronchialis]|uniref:Peptidase S8 and S53 subtilisin kexin sedolisin n=1 Tax=Peterkaempfera bronchialis TaxID=2126346 RepID=A0A345T0R0_9ACTN|nr:S8 family serine peptidase [Peterkaempfera bronchialis]AXI79565.1 hypothetical protein C7M71_021275 [Peterkaempfera bronchialis]